MRIKFDISALGRTRWYEYALRFIFGGAVTVAAGLIANSYGPVFGGLFLAFRRFSRRAPPFCKSMRRKRSGRRALSIMTADARQPHSTPVEQP